MREFSGRVRCHLRVSVVVFAGVFHNDAFLFSVFVFSGNLLIQLLFDMISLNIADKTH